MAEHDVEPGVLVKPVGQLVHPPSVVALKVPAGQLSHPVPAVLMILPGPHLLMHVVDPGMLCLLEGHAKQRPSSLLL